MESTATLICPKCRGEMRSYERNGIVIDQCQECRGIFLDRGELERLVDAESGRPGHDGDHELGEEQHSKHDDRHGKQRRRPTSFFEDLLGGG